VPPKLRVLPSEALSQAMDLKNFAAASYQRNSSTVEFVDHAYDGRRVVSAGRGFVVQLVPTVVRQLARFRLAQRVARSVCDCRAFCLYNSAPSRETEYCDERVCLRVCVCLSASGKTHPNFTELFCLLPMSLARSVSGGVAIRYVLPVSVMTWCLHTKAEIGDAKRRIFK